MQSTDELVEQAKAGSKEAFTELVSRFHQPLYRFLVLRSATVQDAEDRFQETCLRAYRYLHSYNPKWSFNTWLYNIAARIRPMDQTSGDLSPELASDDPSAFEKYAAVSARDNLWSIAKRALNQPQLDALWLHYAEDRSTREIALILGKSTAWVKVNLFRARRVVKDAMEQQGLIEANV